MEIRYFEFVAKTEFLFHFNKKLPFYFIITVKIKVRVKLVVSSFDF